MIAGFIIWSAVTILLIAIGIRMRKSKKAVSFYTGVKPPEITDVRKYNRSVSNLLFAYAILFELLGIPFLFQKQNKLGFLWSVFGTVAITIALMIAYNRILEKYRAKHGKGKGDEKVV